MVESNEWGTGTWGTGVWGTQLTLDAVLDNSVLNRWPFQQIRPTDNDAIRNHIRVYGLALDRAQARIEDVQRQQSIDTATDERLDKLAGEVDLVRETGESDQRLRFRTRIQKAVTRSDGTLSGFETVLAIVFGETQTASMKVSTPSSEPIVQVTMPSQVVSDAPLTETELEDALDDAIPATDRLRILTDDTFIFGESGNQGIGQGGLL